MNIMLNAFLKPGTEIPSKFRLPGWLLLPLICAVIAAPARGQVFGCNPAAANPIVCENSKQGNSPSEWDISGAGDSSIQGFATEISVNQGQAVHFKVKTDARAYRIDIYRVGYYGGQGARQVASILPSVSLPQSQPACLSDASSGLIDCGNWGESGSWVVPANATSGIYIAKLVRLDTGGASHMVFVVRADAGGSQMLFQTSDTTWQAYNDYGGNSLYTGSPAGRAYKVSYNRPFNTRAAHAQSYFFNAEYPMVRWLEASGYDVSYFTGVDTDRNGSLIVSHKVFLSVGDDEYWSGNQRANVEAARAAGVHLAFFSGDELFWKTRWGSSIDGSNSPYRTMVCYKETLAGQPTDPADPPTWTGTWRDPRFSPPGDGGRPENALTGTLFYVQGVRNDAIAVPALYGRLRFWRNTAIAALQPGEVYTFPVGTLGYAWDQEVDNGFRPAGLFDLSSTTLGVSPDYLADYGSSFGPGTATHNLALYRASSGALVFGAGTVQWSWGLDATHDSTLSAPSPTDSNLQQATVNLLADMGVQAGTPQLGLFAAAASTDVTPPSSNITSPSEGASVPTGSSVTITGTAADAGGGEVAGVEVSVDGGKTWHRAVGLENWSYVWTASSLGSGTLKSRAVDDSGNLEAPSSGITVTFGPALASLAVTPSNASVLPGGTQQFTATGTFSDGSTQNLTSSVTWTSKNTGVATISGSGLATGVGTGNTTIQASSGPISSSTGLSVAAVRQFTMDATVPASTTFPYITYDMWLDFEATQCTALAAPTVACLTNSTHGAAGTWSIADTNSLLTIQTAAQAPKPTGDTGTKGMAINLTKVLGDVGYTQLDLPSDYTALSFGLWYRTAQPTTFTEGPHFITLYNGSIGRLEALADERDSSSDDRVIRLSPFAGSAYEIPVDDNTWYWCTMKWVKNGTGAFSLYDSSLNLVGNLTFVDAGSNVNVQSILLGNAQATTGGTLGSSGTTAYFDDLIVDYTNANFPLLPSSTLLPPIITSLSPASVNAGTPALTLSINGTNFLSTSTVTYNGTPKTVLATPPRSAVLLAIALTTGDVATGGSYPVIVTNPSIGPSAPFNFNVNNPVPTLTSISPTSATAGAAAATLTLTGTNFVTTSTVTYNAVAHTATFVNSTHLTITLSTSDLATGGIFPVVVTNPTPVGGTTSAQNFTVNNGAPTITSLSPASITAGAAAQTLTITGTNFVSTSTVTYNAVAHTPAFVDSTHLTIALTTGDQATAGNYPVVVTNPTPGGGSSTGVNFVVNNPAPTITSLAPASANAGAAAQTLTINGTGFVSASTVTYNAVTHTVLASPPRTSTLLAIALTTGDQVTGGNYAVVVTNPTPGGGSSTAMNFTVNNLVPTVTTLSPSSALAGAAAQTLTITGTNFVSTSTVTYNGTPHTPTFVNATHLTIPLTTGDQATAGNYPVVVTNPTPGGGSSTPVNFVVNSSVPTISSLSPASVTAGAAAQTVTITGTNFTASSTVTYNAVDHPAGFVDVTHLTIVLSTSDLATAGTFPVVVTTPPPGGGTSLPFNFIVNNPVPTITSLSPASASAGAAAQTVTITGTNFLSTSTVTYNAVAHTPTFVDATHLTISLSAADQATGGTYPVVVSNPTPGGGPSSPVNFTVNNLAPTITSLSPASGTAGGAAQTLTITGTNFVSTSTVTFNAVAHTPTYVSPTQLTITLSVSDLATAGTFAVLVTNPTPGGGTSSAVNFIANNAVPTITTLSPPSALVGAAAQTLTINGTNFLSTSTVTYNSVAHPATFVDATHLTISLSVADQATAGNYPVVVTNPTPGGGSSAPVSFTVNNLVPTITNLSPSTTNAGAAAQTVTITGTNFLSTSTVTYNAVVHTPTFVSATQLTIPLTTGDQATGGNYPVVVTNPTPGGGPSTPATFTVNNPMPNITTLSPSSALAGAAAQTLTINGTNFVSTSAVTYNAVAHTPTFVDSTHLTISLTAADQATAGTYPVVVTNPAPGGGASNSVNFTLNNGVPTITSLSPPSAVVGSAGQTVTIIGTNFVSTSTVTYNGPSPSHTATFVDSTHLTISLSTSDLATAGNYPVIVTNPTPGGGSSTPVNFGVGNPIPAITGLSPSSANAGAAAQTLTITGTNFLSTSTVTYNAVAHTAAFVDSQHLTISLTAADQATGGNYPVIVTNPTPGGGASSPVNFTVNNPVPLVTALSPSSGIAGAGAQTLTITGTGFVSTSAVTYNAVAHTATFVSSTQLTISLTTADQAAGGTFPVVVTNPAPGGGASSPVNFTLADFSVAPASNSATVTAGGTATYNLSIDSVNGLTGSVSFTCSGAPSEATCTVNPASVSIPGSTTVTVSTTARSAVLMRPKPPTGPWIWLWMWALLAAVGVRLMAGRRLAWNRAWAPLAVAMLRVALWAGCGGGGGGGTPTPRGTPAGTYSLTVTGTYTSGTTTVHRNITLTLKVN